MVSRSDYPKGARVKAASAIARNLIVGNKCMTAVGKMRAQQLAQGKPLSPKTLKRTKSFLNRAEVYNNPKKPMSCGSIAFDGWGGLPMKRFVNNLDL